MAAVAESSDSNPQPSPTNPLKTSNPGPLDQATPWIDYAVHQFQCCQKAFQETFDSSFEASKTRLSQIRSTSSAHFQQTIESLRSVKSEYDAYEDVLFGKVKEGILVAASRPMFTCGVTTALGLLVLKRPRHFLYNNTLRLFVSEETLLAKADSKVKELRQSIDLLKAETDKLEKTALHAEEEMLRGRTKLKQAGRQIQSVIRSAYKIERQAAGLKDILGDLPRREASKFGSQVSALCSEVKREKSALTKEVAKISNYGISV